MSHSSSMWQRLVWCKLNSVFYWLRKNESRNVAINSSSWGDDFLSSELIWWYILMFIIASDDMISMCLIIMTDF